MQVSHNCVRWKTLLQGGSYFSTKVSKSLSLQTPLSKCILCVGIVSKWRMPIICNRVRLTVLQTAGRCHLRLSVRLFHLSQAPARPHIAPTRVYVMPARWMSQQKEWGM